MGITGRVAGYTTYYGGEPNRIHNVQLVARLIDGAVIAPGSTFSFNGTTGERSPDRGFREAPVIINGELQNGIGGGVCQVSTTVFNAAYEAGLPIETRTNHALYISHYPQGRDATVNFPDIDLKFRNDTGKWLLLRTFVGSSALTVKLYGTPPNRRVESETAPLEVTGPPGVKRVPDPNMWTGVQVVEDFGEPSRKTSATRRVYSESGKLLSETTWTSWYRSEPKTVRYGTKPRPKEPPPPPPPPKDKGKKPPPPPPPPPPAEPTPPPPG
jgi:vancomycin resistance protein YoaR